MENQENRKAPLPALRLYHYWRSSSSWRVRWAFAFKGIACELVPVGLLDGEAESEAHRRRNPLGFVPALEIADQPGAFLGESMAIIEWAEERVPSPSLLPGDAFQRARIRQLAETINASTQPLQNLNVTHAHSPDAAEQKRWNQHWIRAGLAAYETLARATAGKFSVGDSLTLADRFLVPQCYNAARNEVALAEFPLLERIEQAALQTPSARASEPARYAPAASPA